VTVGGVVRLGGRGGKALVVGQGPNDPPRLLHGTGADVSGHDEATPPPDWDSALQFEFRPKPGHPGQFRIAAMGRLLHLRELVDGAEAVLSGAVRETTAWILTRVSQDEATALLGAPPASPTPADGQADRDDGKLARGDGPVAEPAAAVADRAEGMGAGPAAAVQMLPPAESDFIVDVNDLAIGAAIGSGATATVHRARYRGTEVAVKMFHVADADAPEAPLLLTEARMLRLLRHPHILTLMGHCPSPPLILTELMDTSLQSLLMSSRTVLRPTCALFCALGIARGLAYVGGGGGFCFFFIVC
jgi:hypothetical protein